MVYAKNITQIMISLSYKNKKYMRNLDQIQKIHNESAINKQQFDSPNLSSYNNNRNIEHDKNRERTNKIQNQFNNISENYSNLQLQQLIVELKKLIQCQDIEINKLNIKAQQNQKFFNQLQVKYEACKKQRQLIQKQVLEMREKNQRLQNQIATLNDINTNLQTRVQSQEQFLSSKGFIQGQNYHKQQQNKAQNQKQQNEKCLRNKNQQFIRQKLRNVRTCVIHILQLMQNLYQNSDHSQDRIINKLVQLTSYLN